MKPDKLAEEIISKYDIDFVTESDREYYTNEIIRAMQEYYKSKLAKITDEDIWNAAKEYAQETGRAFYSEYFTAYKAGATEMRDNKIYILPKEIKHT